jgi:DNA helicase-2/ATP-dependent DNA helicase PcrA
MASTPDFDCAYQSLNEGQKAAVDTIDGPVMVIAGPGTGKTTVLALRIANILQKTDTPPDGILALTFTDAAVRAMREKLAKFAGAAAAAKVEVHTFHSYAARLIERHPEAFPEIIGGRHLAETEKLGLIAELLEQNRWEHLKPVGDPTYYTREAAGALSHLKRENQTPGGLRAWLDEEEKRLRADENNLVTRGPNKGKLKATVESDLRKIARTRELASLSEKYDAARRERKVYDFDDMLYGAVRALESDAAALAEARETALYILADEHQDANASQNRILELLAGDEGSPNLFVVGDEKQAIFRFQGASLANFLFFASRYPGTKLVKLTDNYRSRQPILDAAAEIVGPAPEGGMPRPRLSGRETAGGAEIEIVGHATRAAELAWIADEAKRAIGEGIEPGEIAVIARQNAELFEAAEWLRAAGLPVSLEAERDIASHPDTRRALAILRAALNPGQDDLVLAALSVGSMGVPPADLARAARAAADSRRALLELARADGLMREYRVLEPEKLKRAGRALERLAALVKSAHTLEFLEACLYESGLARDVVTSNESVDRLPALERLFGEAEAYSQAAGDNASPAGFLAHLDAAAKFGAKLSARPTSQHGGVRLLTAHASKGLEFARVYVAGVTRDKWEGKPARRLFHLPAQHEKDEEEIRRLLFVAVTRAKDYCAIAHAAAREDGKALTPSAMVLEIAAERREAPAPESSPVRPGLARAARVSDEAAAAADAAERAVIRELFRARPLAVTALQNYLDCPWKFVYRSLLRLPSARTRAQDLGTATHAVLAAAASLGEAPTGAWARERLAEELAKIPLLPEARAELLAQGGDQLVGFLATRRFGAGDRAEVKVSGVSLDLGDWQLPLTGNIDLVSEQDGALRVTDYKLSRPKSEAWVRGEAKGSDGRYLRQLRFYKLLLERSAVGKGKRVAEGAIAFARPDARGGFREVSIELGPGDVFAVEAETLAAAREIDALAFWDRRCDDPKCPYCPLRDARDA